MTKRRNKAFIDDGCNPELVIGAKWSGIMEVPTLESHKHINIPERLVPFTHRNEATENDIICFFEDDEKFSDVLRNYNDYIPEFRKTLGITSFDNSVLSSAPLSIQITNIYKDRAFDYYYQQAGLNVYPLVRWGDERTYTTCLFPECIAFNGIPKHDVVVVGSYGCCQTNVDKYHLRAGMDAMLDILKPEIVLVYGSMNKNIFSKMLHRSTFIHYDDWMKYKIRGGLYGQRSVQ